MAAAMPLATAVGSNVNLVASCAEGDIPENLDIYTRKWLTPFIAIQRVSPLPRGIVVIGTVLDQDRLVRNLKAGQVRLKGCLFNVDLLSEEDACHFATLLTSSDSDSDGEMDVSRGSSFDEFATPSEDDLTTSKRPRSPTQKARKKAYKKRRRQEKRRISVTETSSSPSASTSNTSPGPPPWAPPTTSTSAAQPAATPATSTPPTASTPAATLQAEAPPPATTQPPTALSQGDATKPSKRARRQRFVGLDFSKVDVPVPTRPARVTFLFRPVDPSQSLQRADQRKLFSYFNSYAEVLEIRNIRCGGLAVDFPPDTAIPASLTIFDIKVAVSRPLGSSPTSAGVITGVHPDLSNADLMESIITDVPVSATRRLAKAGTTSWVVKLSFSSSPLPAEVKLLGRVHPVKPYDERPLQCYKCSRYGHPARVCRSQPRCRICGEGHESSTCSSPSQPKCCNCGGPHQADSPLCANRAFQVKVMEVRKVQNVTFREARSSVTQAARSYAAALKRPTAATPVAPPTSTPPSPPEADNSSLAAILKAVLLLLVEAAASNNYTGIAAKVAAAFTCHMDTASP